MSIQFRCDQCDREYDLPEMAAGKKAKCECGVMLVVPVATPVTDPAETFDPAAPSEIGARPTPKPPRTPAAAARQAAPPPPMVEQPPPAPDPEAPAKTPEPPVAEASSVPPPEVPPPLPPAYRPHEEPQESTRVVETRYRNLRAYCGWLRLVSWLVLAATGLIVVSNLAIVIPRIEQFASSPLSVATMLIPALVSAATGAGLFVLINATVELFHVLMDIEENTRRH